MQIMSFGNNLFRTKQLILWVILIQLIIALVAGIMFNFWGKPMLRTIELLASIALIIFLLSVAILLFSYLRQPEVRERYRLNKQIRQNEAELTSTQTALSEIQNKKDTIQRQSQEQQAAEQASFDQLNNTIQGEIKRMESAKEQDLSSALARIQKEFMDNGLKNIPLDPALVPGIGEFLAEKLSSAGIMTAFDISRETIQRISGFGEAKTLSLLRWRESEENQLIANQPTALASDDQAAIEQKYDQLIGDKQTEAKAAQSSHETALQAILSKETGKLAELAETEISSHLQLTSLTNQKQDLQDQFNQYRSITFLRMLLTALTVGQTRWANRAGASVLLVLFFVLGLINPIILIGAIVVSRT